MTSHLKEASTTVCACHGSSALKATKQLNHTGQDTQHSLNEECHIQPKHTVALKRTDISPCSKQIVKTKSEQSQECFFTSPAFIRALIALALISSSRSSSCCADGWTSSDGGTAKVAALGSFGLDSANPRISFTLFSMSFWRSSIWPAPLLTVLSCTSGPSSSLHGPSMSLSYASAFMLRTSLSSPLPVTQI